MPGTVLTPATARAEPVVRETYPATPAAWGTQRRLTLACAMKRTASGRPRSGV